MLNTCAELLAQNLGYRTRTLGAKTGPLKAQIPNYAAPGLRAI
jgi:hypothetical protein